MLVPMYVTLPDRPRTDLPAQETVNPAFRSAEVPAGDSTYLTNACAVSLFFEPGRVAIGYVVDEFALSGILTPDTSASAAFSFVPLKTPASALPKGSLLKTAFTSTSLVTG